MTDDRTLAQSARAWPFEEARRVLQRIDGKAPKKGYVLFETGYGPSGLPHIGTFGEVARTSMVRRAFELMTGGAVPTRPETGYGYIRSGAPLDGETGDAGAKPDTAQALLDRTQRAEDACLDDPYAKPRRTATFATPAAGFVPPVVSSGSVGEISAGMTGATAATACSSG